MQYLREAKYRGTAAAVSEAWRQYLVAVRSAGPESYEEIEEQAWEELLEDLFRLGRTLPIAEP